MPRPIIGVTLGDPAGVGPEVVVKSLSDPELFQVARPLIIGDADTVQEAMQLCDLNMELNRVTGPQAGRYTHGTLDLLDLDNLDIRALQKGAVQAMSGRAAYEYIAKAVELAGAGGLDAIATSPINKESLRAAGVAQVGHTEIMQELSGCGELLTLFEVRGLRTFFLSRHVSLRAACDLVTKERLLAFIARCADALERLGIREGTMAVAGLNPHCGEHGLFGDEEVRHVAPAVQEAGAAGYRVEGPIGADSVYHQALQGRYSAVLSLYHDQGHIATKTLDFERTISLTIGMPFLRTSVDHGTALDIAWRGQASEVSMTEAILLAARYSASYRRGG
jgi:4-hydroxythreonine-4-phosphate dehydrogenase